MSSQSDKPQSYSSGSTGSSSAAGPYAPRNNLYSTTAPNYSTSTNIHSEVPKFGSTTPLKPTLHSRSLPSVNQEKEPGNSLNLTAQFMQPIKATAPSEEWHSHTLPTIDLTGDDMIIKPPVDYPTFASAVRGRFTVVNPGTRNNPYDFTGSAPINRNPPIYSLPPGGVIPGMTHYGGEYLDPTKTTESLKELLEGINDVPVPKKSKKKKKKKPLPVKEEAELAESMAAAGLDEKQLGQRADGDVEEEPMEAGEKSEKDGKEEEEDGEEEEEEEEEDNRVDGLNVTLLPHQVRGLAFLQSREGMKGRGGILADDMGLGKTIQSIALILSHPHPKFPVAEDATPFADLSPNSKSAAANIPKDVGRGTLVVAPLALIKQWEAEIERRTESTHPLRVLVHHGSNRAKDPKTLCKYDVVITTYDIIRSEHTQSSFAPGSDGRVDAVGCFGIRWWRIICDEAHTIKNRTAKLSIAACALKARHRWCLTGTPLQNNLDELYSLFKFLRIEPMSDYAVWKEQISRPMQQNKGKIAIDRLRMVLSAIMLRRTKDVLKKDAEGKSGHQIRLPERSQEKVVGKFNAQEQTFYDKLEERTEESLDKMMAGFGNVGGKLGGVNMTSALVLLLRLRQACNHPHLLAGKIHKDKDSGMGLATPRKKKATKGIDGAAEDHELAGLMGGLSVDQRKCEVCITDLTKQEIEDGNVRCTTCDENLEGITTNLGRNAKHNINILKKAKKVQKRRRPTISGSDDEYDEEGSQAEEGSDAEDGGDDFNDNQAEDFEEDNDTESTFEDDPYSQLLPSTKISGLLEIIKKETKEKNKIIVFSQFTSMLDLIEPFLRQMGIAFTRYDGSMKNDDREASLRRLRGEGGLARKRGTDWCGVLLCSLKCGALGLNLTCASRVVILEPFWNPFIEEQAIDRVHRIGQEKDVVVYKLTIENSVEERILQLQDRKRELAKAAIGDGDMASKAKAAKMSMKDILFLFKRDAEHGARDAPHDTLNVRTRILKEKPSATVESVDPRERRYLTLQEIAEKEARMAREEASVYGRR